MRYCALIHCNLLAVGTYSTSPASAANQDARLTAPDILLRYQDSNTTQSNRIALDIGGTLTKVAFIASDTLEPGFFEEPHTAAAAYPESAPAQQQQYIYKAHSAVNTAVNKSGGVAHGARLQFKLFDTACVDEVVEFIAKFAVRGGNLGLATAAAEGVAPVQVRLFLQCCSPLQVSVLVCRKLFTRYLDAAPHMVNIHQYLRKHQPSRLHMQGVHWVIGYQNFHDNSTPSP